MGTTVMIVMLVWDLLELLLVKPALIGNHLVAHIAFVKGAILAHLVVREVAEVLVRELVEELVLLETHVASTCSCQPERCPENVSTLRSSEIVG